MIFFKRSLLWLALVAFAFAGPANADEPVKESRDQRAAHRAKRLAELGGELGKSTGTCQLGTSFKDLDINNVRARLYNTGGLFWKGGTNVYTIPKSGAANSIFAGGIWIGGLIDGTLHMIASDYGPWEMWPGPLDDNGNAPADCAQFDRLYKVNKTDIQDYEATGAAVPDLRDWPFELGAPVVDGDGNPNNYNLGGGDRPAIIGDQTVWWVMNDMGNEHAWSLSQPIGLEVRVTAFAFKTADAINNTTFYKYELINKGGAQLTETYFGIWSDPDMGDSGDDYVGSDTTRGMGITWNGDDFDGTSGGYGIPPAIGYDYFQGPLVNNDGVDNDADGEVDEDDERIAMSKFVYYNNDGTSQGNPSSGDDAYRYLRGFWRDDVPVTLGGTGRDFSDEPVDFMFPADVSNGCAQAGDCFWSEEDTDGAGTRNTPSDRRFLMSSGPFTLDPGAVQEIVYGIVWAQAGDRFASVGKMKSDDALAQAAFNVNFELPPPPDQPRLETAELDNAVVLSWGYRPTDNNYLDSYEVENPFLADVEEATDKTYTFEGYQVYQFTSEEDGVGRVVATFDRSDNLITQITDVSDANFDIPVASVVVNGSNSGVKHNITFENLTNHQDYYYGVQAYGYNVFSAPRVVFSPISRVVLRPSRSDARDGGTIVNLENQGADFSVDNGLITFAGKGEGFVTAEVVDASALTGHTYRVEFYDEVLVEADEEHAEETATNYRLIDETAGETIFDGSDAVASYGGAAPQGSDLFVADGLNWSISGPPPSFFDLDGGGTPAFVQMEGPGGPDDACGPTAGSTFGCSIVGGNFVYGSFSGHSDFIMYHEGTGAEGSIGSYAPQDYEIRFTETGSYAYHPFTTGNANWVPYEVWDIGPTGPFGVNDPADDVQMIGNTFSSNGDECFWGYGETPEDVFGLGWPGTDRIYAYYPVTDYATWADQVGPLVDAHPDGCPTSPETDVPSNEVDFGRGRPLQRIVFYGDPAHPNYRDEGPAVGTILRFLTTKPNLPGDVFTVNTAGFGVVTGDTQTAKEALDLLAIVPNPYKGASDYETSNLRDAARLTNLPAEATIRVFTLSGTLVKTIVKDGPETSIDWNLQTEEGLPLASGMYLVHIEVPGVGEKVIKFGVIKKQVQLDLL